MGPGRGVTATGLIWLKIEAGGELKWAQSRTVEFHKMRGIS